MPTTSQTTTQAAHPSRLAAIFVALLVAGCQDFAPTNSPAVDGGAAPTLTMSCDGTKPNPGCSGGASDGLACTMDCCFPPGQSSSCGIRGSNNLGLGYRTCTCPNGVYEWCNCFPPPEWPTLPAGGDCSPKGTSAAPPVGLNGVSCTKKWTTCWTVPDNRGCVCLADPTTGNLNLRCGSPGTWFKRVYGVKTEY